MRYFSSIVVKMYPAPFTNDSFNQQKTAEILIISPCRDPVLSIKHNSKHSRKKKKTLRNTFFLQNSGAHDGLPVSVSDWGISINWRERNINQAPPTITRIHFPKGSWYKEVKGRWLWKTELLLGEVKNIFEGWFRILCIIYNTVRKCSPNFSQLKNEEHKRKKKSKMETSVNKILPSDYCYSVSVM